MAVFEGKQSSDDIIIKDKMSDDEVVAPDVPPAVFFMQVSAYRRFTQGFRLFRLFGIFGTVRQFAPLSEEITKNATAKVSLVQRILIDGVKHVNRPHKRLPVCV